MPIEGVVADANVLLSAVVGKAALRVFTEFDLVVHVAQFNTDEVAEYLPHMANKYGLPVEFVEMQWKLLSFRVHPVDDYRSRLPQALTDLKDRDPEDAHVLALARWLALPIWSNDRDLSGLDVECYTTARLLRLLAK
ncbi:MAG TPA: PIN domain-containing protein [Candidatus Binatia bacterium]|jgi:predicted nucleic acid-binding protein|nr:PIN domain-containing protein [Candidatus Binatia bacterium]